MTRSVNRPVVVLGCLCAMMTLSAMYAAAQPRPSIVPRSWELQVSYETPRVISVRGIDGRTQWYWYMPYRVVNNTEEERFFSPEVTVATDLGHVVIANENVPARVYAAVRERLNNPLLEHPVTVSGRILIGEDYARSTVAIWPMFPDDVDVMNVFISGVSGETASIEHPVTGEQVVLTKTLMIDFATPGTEVHPQRQPITRSGERWIMR